MEGLRMTEIEGMCLDPKWRRVLVEAKEGNKQNNQTNNLKMDKEKRENKEGEREEELFLSFFIYLFLVGFDSYRIAG